MLTLPTARKRRKKRPLLGPEDRFQQWMVTYLRYTLPPHWIVHHSANEEANGLSRLKEAIIGKVGGFPDVLIMGEHDVGFAVPRIVPGCWLIEAKAGKNKLSDEQKDFHAKLRRLGFQVGTVWTPEDVYGLVRDWNLPTSDLALRQ